MTSPEASARARAWIALHDAGVDAPTIWRGIEELARQRDALAAHIDRDTHAFIPGPPSDPEACWVKTSSGARCCYVRDADMHQTAAVVLAELTEAHRG